jgi:hypothetical protein
VEYFALSSQVYSGVLYAPTVVPDALVESLVFNVCALLELWEQDVRVRASAMAASTMTAIIAEVVVAKAGFVVVGDDVNNDDVDINDDVAVCDAVIDDNPSVVAGFVVALAPWCFCLHVIISSVSCRLIIFELLIVADDVGCCWLLLVVEIRFSVCSVFFYCLFTRTSSVLISFV